MGTSKQTVKTQVVNLMCGFLQGRFALKITLTCEYGFDKSTPQVMDSPPPTIAFSSSFSRFSVFSVSANLGFGN